MLSKATPQQVAAPSLDEFESGSEEVLADAQSNAMNPPSCRFGRRHRRESDRVV